jgi:hypothetical protein
MKEMTADEVVEEVKKSGLRSVVLPCWIEMEFY